MGSSKINATLAFFLLLNILFFTFASACDTCPKPKPKPKPKPCPPTTPTPSKPTPTPSTPTPSTKGKCPIDALKLGVCGDLLGGLINIVIGTSKQPCCSLLEGLADVDAAVCLCTAIKANVLGINLNVPVSLSLLLNACGHKATKDFKCA